MSTSNPHVRLITFFVWISACLLRTVRMQLNFPIAVITAIAFALGFVADVASAFSLSRSLINPSTLLERSSDGIGIFIANVSDQAPAALDSADTTDSSSRLSASVLLAVGCILSFVLLCDPPKMISSVADQSAQALQGVPSQLLNRLSSKTSSVTIIE